jgi:hypothetical protein
MEEERVLTVFERKILRKMYGPVKENELWRIRRNDELEDIIVRQTDEPSPCFPIALHENPF